MSQQLPVIIAGSGPAGSTLALYLARQDIPVLMLDREADLPVDLRASTFHPPTLEMLNQLGVAAPMIAKGLIVDRYQYRDSRSGEVAEFDMSVIDDETLFPYRLQLEQYELTRIISRVLRDYDCAEVRFEHEVVGFSQDATGVDCVVKTPPGNQIIRGAFLVGADGAASNVRKAAGIDYSGFTYNERFLVASTSFPFEEVFDNLAWVNYVAGTQGWCVLQRTEKRWRVMWPTDPANDDETLYLSDAYIQDHLHHLYNKEGDYDIAHRALYHVHQRVAESYFQGRVVLIGDACHINNPLGGMGMNGGLHDAFNLAEKLTAIINDGADYKALIGRYDRQRRELAIQFVQEHTINNKKQLESDDPDSQARRQRELMEIAADPARAREFVMDQAMMNYLRENLEVQ